MNGDLKRAHLSCTFVGAAKDALMIIGNSHVVLRVCSQFGNYVKFSVDSILGGEGHYKVLLMCMGGVKVRNTDEVFWCERSVVMITLRSFTTLVTLKQYAVIVPLKMLQMTNNTCRFVKIARS